MALRDLIEGECGQGNTVTRLTSIVSEDFAHKDDLRPFSHTDGFNASEDEMVNKFMEGVMGSSPQTFHMDSLLQEMREIECAETQHAPIQAPGVAALAASDPTSLTAEHSSWAEQYLESGKQFDQEPRDSEIWKTPVDRIEDKVPKEEVFELGFGPHWARDYMVSTSTHQFHREDLPDLLMIQAVSDNPGELEEAASNIVQTLNDLELQPSKFMKFMKLIENGDVTVRDGQVIGSSVDSEMQNEDTASVNVDEKHSETYAVKSEVRENESKEENKDAVDAPEKTHIVTNEELIREATTDATEKAIDNNDDDAAAEYSKKLWNKLQDEWERIFKNDETAEHSWVSEFSESFDPFKDYPFEDDNPMMNSHDALELGKKKLEEGDLAGAVLCFEAAAVMNPDSSETWELLGTSQAENEQDTAAIAALRKCIAQDPANLKALMALAVSYTNESYQNQACLTLKEWLKQNPIYNHLVPKEENTAKHKFSSISSLLTRETHREVQDLFIQAARLSPAQDIDADVQCGLGVLFNLSNEYDKAVDCFKAALSAKPDDSRLWNRLGATLANGDRSIEAVEAYRYALKLSPGFIRARYNLGITCLNLGAYKEAADHLLIALNQQEHAKGVEVNTKSWCVTSENVWSTLRVVVTLLDRRELLDSLDARDLKAVNRGLNFEY